jgi:cell fate regulator YaaT (PSP1 superfamily)
MKSCNVKIDRVAGVTETEVPDDILLGDHVVIELDKGPCLGIVMTEPQETQKEGIKKVTRKATEEEVAQYFSLKENEKHALDFCRQKIKEMNLPMKLLFAEYLFGGAKLLYYFISESRVDFRELVKELAKEFKIRIELRQVGVRDEAKIIGGLGNCGNICCCKKFLNNFSIVSIKMVKEQGLALNPAKISGRCAAFPMSTTCMSSIKKASRSLANELRPPRERVKWSSTIHSPHRLLLNLTMVKRLPY